jgi:hypothetical protein
MAMTDRCEPSKAWDDLISGLALRKPTLLYTIHQNKAGGGARSCQLVWGGCRDLVGSFRVMDDGASRVRSGLGRAVANRSESVIIGWGIGSKSNS